MRKADLFYKQSGLYGNMTSLGEKKKNTYFIEQLSIILNISYSLYTEGASYILETDLEKDLEVMADNQLSCTGVPLAMY